MSMRSVLIPLAFVATLLAGCGKNPAPSTGKSASGQSNSGSTPTNTTPDDPNPDVGTPLYTAAPPAITPPAAAQGNDPIAIPCIVQYEERQQLAAESDGKVEIIATPFTLVNAGKKDERYEYRHRDDKGNEKLIVYDPAKMDKSIVFHPRDLKKEMPCWKLNDGDRVSEGQVVCLLDDQLWIAKKIAAEEIMKASEKSLVSAKEGVALAARKVKQDEDAGIVVALADLLNDKITYERFVENECQAWQSIAKAKGDLQEALVNLKRLQIETRVDGVIRSIAKRPGEFVRSGEKIMEIQSTEKVRLEGNVDAQYFDRLRRHMDVSVEPATPSAPIKSHAWHRSEVSGIAVTGHAKHPLVVSASRDGSALIWDPNLSNETTGVVAPHTLPHPVAVRSVACTPPDSGSLLVLTGAEDGKVRIWDVTNPTNLPKVPTLEVADAHGSGVHAIAVSPDGKFAASAAGREVFIWELPSGKKLYALPQEHRDTVTSLAFTPQTLLVTASKDGSVKIWKMGGAKAAVTKTIDHRSGSLDTLGVSPDGSRLLFDQDKSRLDLVTLTDGQTTGQLTNVGPNIAFSTLAIFAPDYTSLKASGDQFPPYTIATVGGEGDLKGGLQVWQASRAGGRGMEVARLMTPNRVPVTCAAFSPHKDRPFLVVGTDRGSVHLWTPSTEPRKKLEGRITNIESSDPRFITVRVEMTNKGLNLLDRSSATVIVDPAK